MNRTTTIIKSDKSRTQVVRPITGTYTSKLVHKTEDTYKYILKDWSHVKQNGESTIRSDIFSMCHSEWCIEIYPSGIDGNGDFISLQLRNMSNFDVLASYVVSVINVLDPSKTIRVQDVEGRLVFHSQKSGDNAWGPDELIKIKTLNRRKAGFCVDNQIIFEVKITVYGNEVESIAEQSILKGRDEILATSLNELMEEDLKEVKIRPFGKLRIEEERSLQDNLISSRLARSSPPMSMTTPSSVQTPASITSLLAKSNQYLLVKYGFSTPDSRARSRSRFGSGTLQTTL